MKITTPLAIKIFVCILALLFIKCSQPTESPGSHHLFKLLGTKITGIDFNNALIENDSVNIIDYEYVYNGGGVGIGDFNRDGLPDVYLAGNMVPGKLYINKGQMKFYNETDASGIDTKQKWVAGVTVVDINQDSLPDIYLSVSGPEHFNKGNLLFVNQGVKDGVVTFSEKANDYNLVGNGNTTHAVFFDYDKDDDLDVYMVVHSQTIGNPNAIRPKPTQMSPKSNDRLYRNDTNGSNLHFTDVTAEAGIVDDANGLGIAIQDLNLDGWGDIYVSNDYLANDKLYINQRDGTFKDEISRYLKHQSYSAMGNDIADINNDGLADIFVLDMLPPDNKARKLMLGGRNFDRLEMEVRGWYDRQYIRNTLQLNNGPDVQGDLSFSEIGQLSGISETHWSWSPLLVDYDNDGYRDLSVTNGYPRDITHRDFVQYRNDMNNFSSEKDLSDKLVKAVDQLPGFKVGNFVFKNNGDLTFSNKAKEWGFDAVSYSYGSACADLDLDGDLDVIINNLNDQTFVYENKLYSEEFTDSLHHYLRIRLVGKAGNLQGIGAKIRLRSKGQTQYYENYPYRGYQSTIEEVIHFGVCALTRIDTIEIIWPDNKHQFIFNALADQLLTISYDNNADQYQYSREDHKPLFTEVANTLGINFKHEESLYVDFKNQPLLPHMYSQNGPGIAAGDVNGDALEDFFIGGAYNQSGCFFIQQKNRTFKKEQLENGTKYEEDMGVLLFDADLDGDLDLYIASGGSEFESGSQYYRHRFFINDGKGNFRKSLSAIPDIRESASCVSASDFDGDGDLDLFVGGRVKPNEFPLPPRSYLLMNESKDFDHPIFRNVTLQNAPGLSDVGMVTSALWTDFNNDYQTDLIVAGEWMPLTFFMNSGAGHLKRINDSLGAIDSLHGWWNSIAGGDFDNDGDTDYIAGNLGLNSKFKATQTSPINLYAKDFDQTGTIDPVISYYQNGVEYPFALREDMIKQMNFMRKKFKTHLEYAEANLSQVFDTNELQGVQKLKATWFQTSYIENKGVKNGMPEFELHALPVDCQFSPVYGIDISDFNGDDHLDVMLTGNFYGSEVTLGRYDASVGCYLQGNGDGNFQVVPTARSGFFVDGDAKGLAQLRSGNNQFLLTAQNAGQLKVFSLPPTAVNLFGPKPLDAAIELKLSDGRKRKMEIYYGSGYLSQSTRTVTYPSDASEILIYGFNGKVRKK